MTVLLERVKLGGPDAHASGSQGFVVNKYMELFTFHKVSEMPDGEVDVQQFPAESTVPSLNQCNFLVKWETRHQTESSCNTAPTVRTEASTMLLMGASS